MKKYLFIVAALLLILGFGINATPALAVDWYLFNTSVSSVSPAGQNMQTNNSGVSGWQPIRSITTTASYWYSSVQTTTIAAGTWSFVVWSDNPGSSMVKIDIHKVNSSGGSATLIASQTAEVGNSATGNHATTYTFSGIGAQSLNNQRLRVTLTKTAGANLTIVYNTNDFATRLITPAAGTATPTPTRAATATPTPTRAATATPTLSGAKAIPGQIEAENYNAMSGIDVESCAEGGQNVGWIEAGDWMDYNVNVQSSTTYRAEYRVASTDTSGRFELRRGSTVLGSYTVPNTGGWQTWTTVSGNVSLTLGAQTLRIYATGGNWNINWLRFSVIATPTPTRAATATPTPSGTKAIPGQIEAENYNAMLGIDVESCSEGGQSVGWIETGDWMDYNVNVQSSTTYRAEYRVASTGTSGRFELRRGSTVLGSYTVPNTGGWQTWTTVSGNVSLTSGAQTLRIYATGSSWNINWMRFSLLSATPTPTSGPTPAAGLTFQIVNGTNGAYSNSQVYWTVLGYDKADAATRKLYWINGSGNMVEASLSQNTVPKNDRMCANISVPLTTRSSFTLTTLDSARMYISYGSPMYLQFVIDGDGRVNFAGPDLNNATDPNLDIYFEFFEFTMRDGQYWGNTTRVDFFSFPLTARLQGTGGYYRWDASGNPIYESIDKTIGDVGTRSQLFTKFQNEVPTEFKGLVKAPYRIVAPGKGGFDPGVPPAPYANYFDAYINEVWSYYTTRDLVFDHPLGTFRGRVTGNNFYFSLNGGGTHVVNKPTTAEVLEGKGAFDRGTEIEKAIQAQLCAAFNRHIVIDPANWNNKSRYYLAAPANYYAKFWHDNGIDGLAYGFCYDDVNEQATLLFYSRPQTLTITCKWN